MTVPIVKSTGVTQTEQLLADLCEKTFLTLWSYPNPVKDDGKELCDLIAVFDDHVFIFFDRESKKFQYATKDTVLTWSCWKKDAVDKQVVTARGAERYMRSGRDIYLDSRRTISFPLTIPANPTIHKIVVAHGAKEACSAFSAANVSGSLAIVYGQDDTQPDFPFMVGLDKTDIVHVLDSENLEIMLQTLDTVFDFTAFVTEKERAIRKYDAVMYCGEEDLLAHYLVNYSEDEGRYVIGIPDPDINSLIIGEGEWQDLEKHPAFARRREANKISYLWDDLINLTCRNALDGTLQGNVDLLRGESALREMAREPRFHRRALSEQMRTAINTFPESPGSMRKVSLMPSFYEGTAYVFLQLKLEQSLDYDAEYRPLRQKMLEVACAAAKERDPSLKKVIGIAIDSPKFADQQAEDFILLNCRNWPEHVAEPYREANEHLQFFKTSNLIEVWKRNSDFPS